MKELSLEEAALAWAQGKRVEAIHKTIPCRDWSGISKAGESNSSDYSCGIFADCGNKYSYRLAPEPPAKKFRPWTPDEVPVGVKMRENGCEGWFTPTCAGDGEIETVVDDTIQTVKLTELAEDYEHSLDGGKTWLPCGVEVDA